MNKDLKIPAIIVLVIAIISLGVAFAAFNSSLTINGNSTIDSSTWDIVFEGLDSEHPTVLGSPTIPQGSTASVITAPTINNNQTDISSFSVSLSTPGDSITYNFKVHNRGTVPAKVTSLSIPQGVNLTTNTSRRTSDADTLNNIEYKLYYTESNLAMGSDNDRDCLSPGESELVSLRIVFLASNDESVLPSTDLVLDNLGVTVTYTSETSCSASAGGGGGNSGGGNTPTPTGDFLTSSIWDDENNEFNYTWSNEPLSSDVYIKKPNNTVVICTVINSVEYCFDETTNVSTVGQFCTTIGGSFTDMTGEGCNSGDAASCSLNLGQTTLYVNYDQGYHTENYSEEYGDYLDNVTSVNIHVSNLRGCYYYKNASGSSSGNRYLCEVN